VAEKFPARDSVEGSEETEWAYSMPFEGMVLGITGKHELWTDWCAC